MPVTAKDIHEMLILTGERDRLREILRERLEQCGWKAQMQKYCLQIVNERGRNIKFEELLKEITPAARAAVPPEVKREMIERIQESILEI